MKSGIRKVQRLDPLICNTLHIKFNEKSKTKVEENLLKKV